MKRTEWMMGPIAILGSATVRRSKMAKDRVYKFVDVVKSTFQDGWFERDQPENDAAGGEPDDGFVFHGFQPNQLLLRSP